MMHILLIIISVSFTLAFVETESDNNYYRKSDTSERNFVEKNDSTPNSIEDLSKFIIKGYEILDSVHTDINENNIEDVILVLKMKGEDTIPSESIRPVLLLRRNNNGILSLARQNDSTVYCYSCGGIMGDPYIGIFSKNGIFTIQHYGGSAWRWSREITFKYSKNEDEWFLHKVYSDSFHASDYENIDSTVTTDKVFEKVKFEDYNIYK
ncbi:MAG: hypothetical protein Kapaf2KO_14920 [Candidatus Kapaibacteriales bacterium]